MIHPYHIRWVIGILDLLGFSIEAALMYNSIVPMLHHHISQLEAINLSCGIFFFRNNLIRSKIVRKVHKSAFFYAVPMCVF
jgi:hypothetical protein